MFTFSSYVLRKYYQATGWNEDNLYANLTRSSTAILDFTVPRGLNFTISKAPNALFSTTYSLNALPSLHGSIGYVFTSCDLKTLKSDTVRFKDLVDRFKVYDQPRRPDSHSEEWLGKKRVRKRDYLMYGRLYIPSGRLDALYSTRVSPTLQAIVAAISEFSPNPNSLASNTPQRAQTGMGLSNVMLSLQHDTGRWCTEYTWSADDGMLGMRVLRNFGKLNSELDDPAEDWRLQGKKRIDEEEAMEGGLKGRLSIGAEVYFSAKEKSAGVSTGIRFTTLPHAALPSTPASDQNATSQQSSPSQPPTTLTAIFNPMMGHISAAYAARISRDLSLCTRFDFNVYSYESEWTLGAEWWLRRNLAVDSVNSGTLDSVDSRCEPNERTLFKSSSGRDEVQGVIKARISTNTDISLMWESRIKSVLVSLGVVSNLASGSKPIRGVGLEMSYFSSE